MSAAALSIAFAYAQPGADEEAARDERWARRDAPEERRRVAERFAEFLNVGAEFAANGLNGRVELRAVAQAAQQGRAEEALAAFEGQFYQKLRDPQSAGLGLVDLSPYARGTAGFGKFPVPVWDVATKDADVLAVADELLAGRARVRGKVVELGAPGRVNWYHPLPYGVTEDRFDSALVPDAGVVSARVFDPLARAFVITRDEKYLDAWSAYLDDWSLNSTYPDRVHPLEIPSTIHSGINDTAARLARQLAAVAAQLPEGHRPLPSRVFARCMRRAFGDYPLLNIVYLRSNPHNWTPFPGLMLTALVGDEFVSSPLFFREARRRNIEDNAVTQNLRDGTENQQDPWYNDNYANTLAALRLLDHRERLPEWREVEWVREAREDARWQDEVREHLRDRVNYQIRLRTPQGEWPIAFRGGDKRQADRASRVVSPEAYADPVNQAVLAGGGAVTPPPYHSEWFPYGGYNLARTGWSRNDGYGALFASPRPGAYGGYRSRSNNLTFGLAHAGEDLLVDDTIGFYMYPSSPVKVDGADQFFHARDGVYKVPGVASHKTYLVRAWTEPSPWRWHASEAFNLMEGVYDGPYGATPQDGRSNTLGLGQGILGVQHQRLVMHVRGTGLWLITDRLRADAPRSFEQAWRIPTGESKATAFAESDIVFDASRAAFGTESAAKIGGRAKVNLTLRQVSSAPLAHEARTVPKDPKNHYMPYGRREIVARWRAEGASQVLTLAQVRENGAPAAGDFTSRSDATAGVEGFALTTPDGRAVTYLSARDGTARLVSGRVTAEAEALLLAGDRGLVLGAFSFVFGGEALTPPGPDFEFAPGGDGRIEFIPVYRPIDPVVIGPERTVFSDSLEVSLTSRTPGVAIHYTLDGSEPTPRSPRYDGALRLSSTTLVKARAFRPGVEQVPVVTSGTHATPVSSALFTERRPLVPDAKGAAARTPGLRFSYWEADWKSLWLDTAHLKPQVRGAVKELFDLSLAPAGNPPLGAAPAPRARPYATSYEGFITVPEDGVYTFHAPEELVYPDLEAGYDLRLWVGQKFGRGALAGRVVGVNEWYPSTRLHAFGSWSVALRKGAHPFKVFFVDYRTDAHLRLNRPRLRTYVWPGDRPALLVSGPGLERQPVPASWLSH